MKSNIMKTTLVVFLMLMLTTALAACGGGGGGGGGSSTGNGATLTGTAFFSSSVLALTPNHPFSVYLRIVSNSGSETPVEQMNATTDANGKLSFQFTNVPTTATAPFLLVRIMDPAANQQLVRQTLVPAPTSGQHMQMGVSEVSTRQTEVTLQALQTAAGNQALLAMFPIFMIPTGAFSAADIDALSQIAGSAAAAFNNYLTLTQNVATAEQLAAFQNGLLQAMRDFAADSKTAVDQMDPDTVAGLYGKAGTQFMAAIIQAAETAGIDSLQISATFDQAGQAIDNSPALNNLPTGEIDVIQATFLADARQRRLLAQLVGYAAAMPVVGASDVQSQTFTTARNALQDAMGQARQNFYQQAFADPAALPDQATIDQALSTMRTAMQEAFAGFAQNTTATSTEIDDMLGVMADGMGISQSTLTDQGFGTLQTTLDGTTQNWPIMMVAANNLMAFVPAFRYLPFTDNLTAQLDIGNTPPLPAVDQLPDSPPYKSLLLLQYDLMLVHLIDLQTMAGLPQPPSQGDLVSIDTTDLANRDAIREGLKNLTAAQIKALMAALSPPQLLF